MRVTEIDRLRQQLTLMGNQGGVSITSIFASNIGPATTLQAAPLEVAGERLIWARLGVVQPAAEALKCEVYLFSKSGTEHPKGIELLERQNLKDHLRHLVDLKLRLLVNPGDWIVVLALESDEGFKAGCEFSLSIL